MRGAGVTCSREIDLEDALQGNHDNGTNPDNSEDCDIDHDLGNYKYVTDMRK